MAFFDSRVSTEVKRKMVKNLRTKPGNEGNAKKYTYSRCENNLDLSDFVTKNSIMLFESLSLPQDFLGHDPHEWDNLKSFIEAKKVVDGLKVINDIAQTL